MAFFNRQGKVTRRDWVEPDRAYARRRCARRALLVTAVICLCLGACGVWAAGPRGTPQSPELYYWFRNTAGPGPEAGVMDARVIALAEALGDNRIEECRELARTLAGGAEDPEVRQQAIGYLVETYLAEGDFAGAREAAREWPAVLSRVERVEREYRRKVGELQRLVVDATAPQQAARAQLETALAHEAFGRVDLADESCWKVVRRYPEAAEAGEAIHRIAELRWRGGDQAGAIAACESVVGSAPNSALGVEACRALFETFLRHEKSGHEAMRQRLYAIAQAHGDTLVACAAGLGVGHLYAAEGMPEIAEARWQEVLVRSPGPARVLGVDASLTRLRYQLGMKASDQQDYAQAVRWLAPMIWAPEFAGHHQWRASPGRPVAISLEKQQTAVFRLGQAYQHLEEWDKAAETFALIARPECGEYEGAVLPLAESLCEAGRWDEAREVLGEFIVHFPESGLVIHANDLLRRMGAGAQDAGSPTTTGGEPCDGC